MKVNASANRMVFILNNEQRWRDIHRREFEILGKEHLRHPIGMDWYYAIDQQQKGPVGAAELRRLVQVGVIAPETLVWCEGMATWAPHGGSTTTMPGTAPVEGVVCAACGRRVAECDAFLLADRHYCAVCKPQVLQRLIEGKSLASPASEEMRNAHMKHEAAVKSIGLLYYLGGGALILLGIAMVAATVNGRKTPDVAGVIGMAAMATIFFVLAGIQIVVGTGLRRLQPWARIPTAILSGIGLLGFPVGTVINGYILYLVLSEKGAKVFSPEYLSVIQETPHLQHKTATVWWVLLGIVLLVIVGGISAAVLSKL